MKHKVLSVKQPWAFLICSGIKDIENRTWKLPKKYKGERVLIHTSAKYELFSSLSQEQVELLRSKGIDKKYLIDKGKHFTSAVIGSVRFVDCVVNHPSIWADKVKPAYPCDNEDDYRDDNGKLDYETYLYDIRAYFKQKPIYNWVVSDAILFDKPILNVKGRLGFWDYDLLWEYEKNLNYD